MPRQTTLEDGVRRTLGAADETADGLGASAPAAHVPLDHGPVWDAITCYFQRHGLTRHMIEAYDAFIVQQLPHIVQESPDIRIKTETHEHVVGLCNVSVAPPRVVEADGVEHDLLPHLARLRGLSYASAVYVDILHDVYAEGAHVERRVFREVTLCHLPAMVGSVVCHTQSMSNVNECPMDQGGYFIMNGVEKAIIAQERLRTNYPFVFPMRDGSKFGLVLELRSCHEKKLRSTSTLYVYVTNTKCGAVPQMLAELPFMNIKIPVLALFRLLGVEERGEAIAYIAGDDACEDTRLLSSILDNDATANMNSEELFEWLGREGTTETTREKRLRYLNHIVSNEVAPHMGLTNEPEVLRAKAAYIGFAIRKLVKVYQGELQADDRDHYCGKRVEPSGMALLFRQVYRSAVKSATAMMYRAREQGKMMSLNVADLFGGKKITNVFRHAFSTGNWGITNTKNIASQMGVVQAISRMSTVATLSNLRRVNTPVARETKAPKPRQLHHTTWGILCCCETPEGIACGLVKNLAMLAHVRIPVFSDVLVGELEHSARALRGADGAGALVALADATPAMRSVGTPVLINGVLHGYARSTADAQRIMTALREKRTRNAVPFDTTVAFMDGAVMLDADGGCLLRPLLVGANMHRLPAVMARCGSPLEVWDALLRDNVIEYVDKQEEIGLRVGLRCDQPDATRYTHYELHPSTIMGLCASLIPFPNHNQSPRNMYQAAMCKQAVSVFALNHLRRMDTVSHLLCEPQRPLVSTRWEGLLGLVDGPTGVNVLIAIATCGGYNQEDSVVINQAAVERGLFRSEKYVTVRDEERAGGGDGERFEAVSGAAVAGRKVGDYSKLRPDGVMPVGAVVNTGDVLIGKTAVALNVHDAVNGVRSTVKHDRSVQQKGDRCVVDAVLTTRKPEGARLVKVRTRTTRAPTVADKLSSRMGQKGVIGRVMPQEDMPFTAEGLQPDIVINPHAIPSRMTIGMLMEILLGKLCAQRCELGDATPFCDVTIDAIADELEAEGIDRMGDEVMYSGHTGEAFEARVFFGPSYYQRLKHMVKDKYHARARGPVQVLTRQPLEGRSRDGGLRWGEMERDALISHGVADVLLERLMLVSDVFKVSLCGRCGHLAQPAARGTHVARTRPHCRVCGTGKHVVDLHMPYASKLLVQELQGMNIGVQLLTATQP